MPYWKLNLGLAALGANKIFIIDSNGTSRSFVKGITNTEIEKANTDEEDNTYKLLIKENQRIELNNSNNISLVRVIHNDEVPSYIPIKNGENYLQTSGIYKYEDLFYLIEGRPMHEGKVYKSDKTKVDSTKPFSHRNMMELFHMYISNRNEEKELGIASIVRKLKSSSIQFDARETTLPPPLHLASRSEEYLYTVKYRENLFILTK